MVLIINEETLPRFNKVKRVYWKRLANIFLPTRFKFEIDYGLRHKVFRTNLNYPVPQGIESWALNTPDILDFPITHNFGDYTPRYWGREDGWFLTIPTPVGNILIHFSVDKKLSVTFPKFLERPLEDLLNNPDLFCDTILRSRCGASDDTTIGRQLELVAHSELNEWTFRLLVVFAAGMAVGYHVL